MELTARPARTEELPAVAGLFAAGLAAVRDQRGAELWLLEGVPRAVTEGQPGRLLGDATSCLVVGCVDDVPVGVLVADRRDVRGDGRVARIAFVFVDVEARGIGIGELLVDAAVAWARAAGCGGIDGWSLPGDREVKNLYERSGLTARGIVVHRRLDGEAAR